jgi:hypothetical protein
MKDTTLRDNVLLVLQVDGAQKRIATLEAEWKALAEALRVAYQAHQDIHRCTLCAQMWDKLAKLTALKERMAT